MNPTIKLYRENKLANEWEIDVNELAEQFAAYINRDELNYYTVERLVRLFVTAPDGLNSVFNESDYPKIHIAVVDRIFGITLE